jgi:hypothetical protein
MHWVVPEKIHTPPTEEISAVRRGDKIVSDNSKCIRTSEGGRGVNSNFLRGGGMDVFWNDPFIKALSRLSLHYSFDTSIRCHFVSFLTCIPCFYIYLVKYFNLNEKLILLKNSSDRIGLEFFIETRIRFGLDNFGSDRILNIRQLLDYKRPIRSDAHLY